MELCLFAVMRAIYKDLLMMMTEDRLLTIPELRKRVCIYLHMISYMHVVSVVGDNSSNEFV